MLLWLKALGEKLIAPVPHLTISSRYADDIFHNGFFVAFILKAINFVVVAFSIV